MSALLRPNGLARAAVRFKPAAFVGTFVALMMSALIVSACGILLETGLRASVPPQRYAGAPVLVSADQSAHHVTGSGEDREDEAVPLPDRARLDDSLVAKAATAPGARTAVADLTFPVQRAGAALGAHNWGSTAFTGETLTAGRAPQAAGEIVTSGAKAGDRVTLTTPEGKRTYRVSGTTTADGVWFTDSEALRTSGHPGRVDAIAVLPKRGVTTDTLKSQVQKATSVSRAAKVHTGDDRGAVEDSTLAYAKENLTGLGGSFGGIATLVAVFTAAGTVALSVGQRAREYALLRAIGTTPRQIRRAIATETLMVAPLAGLLGCLPGIALARWWFGQLQAKGAVPQAVDLSVSWIPLLVAVGATVLTGLVAGYAAARRPSRIKPGQALAQASTERLRVGWIRTPLGIAAAAGGMTLSVVAAHLTGDDAANTALGIVMCFMLAVALLGPLVARLCATLFGLPLRGAGAPASLAAANSRTNSRRLASAITPIVLAMAFSSVLVFMHTSEDRVAADQQKAGITADHIVTAKEGAAGLAPGSVAAAGASPGVTAGVGLLKTSVLVPMAGSLESVSAQAVTGTAKDLARVQDLKVTGGAIDPADPGKVALDASLARSAHVEVGDRVDLRLPDGTKASPTVSATYERGLGLSQVTLSRAALTGHVTNPYDTELWTKGGTTASLAALGAPLARADYTTAQSLDRQLNAWANTTMAAVLGGFAAIAAVNTLAMTVLDRRRELGTLRLIGSTRRQVLLMIRWEALLVACAGIALGTGIALATLIPMMNGLTGQGPYVPPLLYGAFAGSALVLGLAATAIPARWAVRS
ncbi:FtsX-like permease family protein [Streptomyces sp. SID14478]|uniref:ABC transporter permease n=1 Tax=Streptomyces sp. SID14478 TaxID=2706073 RepID=UPI0013D9BFF9|nr:FtsX-like permease family protein [Streptomyces sp. SID14478]NEB75536.1 FtsX-like permease family protein [Streptomyces sp. SID14478]